MNFQFLLNNPKNKYFLLGGVLVFLILIIFIIQSISPKISPTTISTPIIPIVTPTNYVEPITTPTGVFIEQQITFNWGNLKPDFPSSIKTYAITEPLINIVNVNALSNKLNFKPEEKQRSIKPTTNIWSNLSASLFTSLEQNQIIYQKRTDIPPNSAEISQEDSISTAKAILTDLFGEELTKTLSPSPVVRYLKAQLNDYQPVLASGPKTARIIEISFKQDIDSLPVSSLSGSADILSVAIDTQKNLYRLAIYGGYQKLSEQKKADIISFDNLKAIAPSKAQKITAIKDVAYESTFSNTPDITVNVESISLGYFLKSDNTLYPVYFIKGKATGNKLPNIEVTYLVPAISD